MPAPGAAPETRPVFRIDGVNLYYGDHRAVKDVSLSVQGRRITSLIGPSGCGKSTLLRSLNRMNDLIDGFRVDGKILLDGEDLYGEGVDVTELRRRVGMVFQKSNPFPKTIFENAAFGLRIGGMRDRKTIAERVEKSLRDAFLWDEVKDKLGKSALELSGGQQQRLCIARALAVQPQVLLLDEPCSALDPVATAKVEETLLELKKAYTIVIVTHNMQQAARISDETGFLLMGELVEFADSHRIFRQPQDSRTEAYITGRYG